MATIQGNQPGTRRLGDSLLNGGMLRIRHLSLLVVGAPAALARSALVRLVPPGEAEDRFHSCDHHRVVQECAEQALEGLQEGLADIHRCAVLTTW